MFGGVVGATGSNSPEPAAASTLGFIPWATRMWTTSTARRVDGSQLDGYSMVRIGGRRLVVAVFVSSATLWL